MKNFFFKNIYFKNGPQENISIGCDDQGIIRKIEANKKGPQDINIDEFAYAPFVNAHSHAFQYILAGLTENLPLGAKTDSFWSWRKRMYQLALTLSPDDYYQICKMLYREMLKQGIGHVVEFHYLHHAPNGRPYDNLSEMSSRLVDAAVDVGIGLTIVPVFYAQGNFGAPPINEQKRFIFKDIETYFTMLQQLKKKLANTPNIYLGMGAHSLRAVNDSDLKKAITHDKGLPFHIHIAEQVKEVQECVSFYGQRPVQYFCESNDVHHNMFLVHATHILDNEIDYLLKNHLNVVLCPSTEGNLGDGFFPIQKFWHQGGHFCLGTDGHMGIDLIEDLRWLDYGARLNSRTRNIFCRHEGEISTDLSFFEITKTGMKACGVEVNDFFEVGKPLNFITINPDLPLFQLTAPKYILPTLIYSCNSSVVKDHYRFGKKVIENRHHLDEREVSKSFSSTLQKLGIRQAF